MGSPDERVSEEVAARLTSDPWARSLGIECLEIRRGYCRLALTLTPAMLNFQGNPHGGVVFTLADMAFGIACNSHGPPSVAVSETIGYLSAAAPGSRLIAEARELQQDEAGFYEVRVTREDGTLVASVHAVSQRVAPRR
jgi:acyl-CoA thioesterase